MPVQGKDPSRGAHKNESGQPPVATPTQDVAAASGTSGPAGKGLEGAASPSGWTGSDPSTREIDPARRLIDRVLREPGATLGEDLHKLLEHGTDPKLSDSVAKALERIVSANPSLAEAVVTACQARLRITPKPTSPVRGVVVRALIAAVEGTEEGTQHRANVMQEIKEGFLLTKRERAQIEKVSCKVSPQSIADLKKQLPLPRWYHRLFGEGHMTAAERGDQIEAKGELICALAEQGMLLEEVTSLVGYYSSVRPDILQSLHRHVTETSSSLSDKAQKTLWDLVDCKRKSLFFLEEAIVEEILLAGTVSEGVQRSLAKRLLELKNHVPLHSRRDKWVIRMCMQLYERRECVQELIDLFVEAKNDWPIGALLTGTDPLLEEFEELRPSQIMLEMLDSYQFDDKTGVSTFTVPAGVTDVEAMKALNKYFSNNLPYFRRHAVNEEDLDWYEKLPQKRRYCQERDYSQARQITITGVVKNTIGENRTTQESVLRDNALVFSDPRDQAIAAALHACKYGGEDLFEGEWVCGSVPGYALSTNCQAGVSRSESVVDRGFDVAASGSPPELK